MLMRAVTYYYYAPYTEDSMDYQPLSTTISFESCETRQCINISIVSDLIDEPEESFNYTLERTPDLDPRISLDPVEGEIVIESQCPDGCSGGIHVHMIKFLCSYNDGLSMQECSEFGQKYYKFRSRRNDSIDSHSLHFRYHGNLNILSYF